MISSIRIPAGKITSSACRYYKTTQFVVDTKKFKKIMEKMAHKKKPIPDSQKLLEKSVLPSAYHNVGLNKRLSSLNKIYMEHITLMVNNGAHGRQLSDLGIEISKVNIAGGLNFLNIYWVSRKDGIPESVINRVLSGTLAELQQQMGTMRFTSKVPLLKFVKDIRLEREIKLDRIFETADFGKDFEPAHGKKVFTQDFVSGAEGLPQMRQNVLGLDHAKIKGRILADIFKFKAINTEPPEHEAHEAQEDTEKQVTPHKLIEFNKTEFVKFYKRRRILALKMRKKEKQAGDNLEYEEYVETYEQPEEYENIPHDIPDDYSDMYEEEEDECHFQR